jgi:hypothetical protein
MTWGRRFNASPKEGVLWIFITVKNPFPLPGLNRQTLNPVANTLTITPPRRQFKSCSRRSGSFNKTKISIILESKDVQ